MQVFSSSIKIYIEKVLNRTTTPKNPTTMFSASTTELYFPKPHNRVITNTVKFTNNTAVDAVIKMRTTSREKFHVRPRIFSIRRGESIEVSVSSRVLPADLPEITDKGDECHAVIHQITNTNTSNSSGVFATPEALQLAWDAGSHLGRVVLRCLVAEPPETHKLTFAAPSAQPSSSNPRQRSNTPNNGGVMKESSSMNDLNQQQHTRGPSEVSNTGSMNNINLGKPPLSNNNNSSGSSASVRNPNSAHNQYQNDPEVQQYQNSSTKNSFNGASLERLSDRVQRHEHALDKNVNQLHTLSQTAKVAAKNVESQITAREANSSGSSNIDAHGRVKKVPLSVAVFLMVLAFLAGVLMKQSAFQHHLDMKMAEES